MKMMAMTTRSMPRGIPRPSASGRVLLEEELGWDAKEIDDDKLRALDVVWVDDDCVGDTEPVTTVSLGRAPAGRTVLAESTEPRCRVPLPVVQLQLIPRSCSQQKSPLLSHATTLGPIS